MRRRLLYSYTYRMAAGPQTAKDAFLCHNGADKAWVTRLAERLEAESIDGLKDSRRISVFLDEWDIDYGENAVNRMGEGLKQCRHLIAVMSPEFFSSGWTNFEWTDVVAEDPWNARKRLIPLFLRDLSLDGQYRIQLPAPFKAARWMDFRSPNAFEREFQKLLRRIRGLPPQRGSGAVPRYSHGVAPVIVEESAEAADPDDVRELIFGNLLSVDFVPARVHVLSTSYATPGDLREVHAEAEPHVISSKCIWSFADLSRSTTVLSKAGEGSSHIVATRDLLMDRDQSALLVRLLNTCLRSHLSKLAIKRDEKGRYFFRPNKDGTSKSWQNGGDRPREVAAKKVSVLDGSAFWVHHAAYAAFRLLGDRPFLQIEPTYVFTSDGNSLLDGKTVGKLAIRWNGRQQNPAVLRNLLFWCKAISGNSRTVTMKTGGEPIRIRSIPALAVVNKGVEGDEIRIRGLMETPDSDLEEAAKELELAEADEAVAVDVDGHA